LEDTQSGFAVFARAREELDLRRASVTQSRDAAGIARLRYEEGADDFLSVLDAERRLLDAESQALDARRRLSQSVISVYRALGAGWR
ncbi:MAG: TolC family protein, partial [Litorimonas sp.]